VLKQADGLDVHVTGTVSPMVYVPVNGEEIETVGIGSAILKSDWLHPELTPLQFD
jgi:hypothetical protein